MTQILAVPYTSNFHRFLLQSTIRPMLFGSVLFKLSTFHCPLPVSCFLTIGFWQSTIAVPLCSVLLLLCPLAVFYRWAFWQCPLNGSYKCSVHWQCPIRAVSFGRVLLLLYNFAVSYRCFFWPYKSCVKWSCALAVPSTFLTSFVCHSFVSIK